MYIYIYEGHMHDRILHVNFTGKSNSRQRAQTTTVSMLIIIMDRLEGNGF